jgi:hypothetical protein
MKQPKATEPTDVGARTKNKGPEIRTQNYARRKTTATQTTSSLTMDSLNTLYRPTGFVGISCRAVALQALPLGPDLRKGVGYYTVLYIDRSMYVLYTAHCQWTIHLSSNLLALRPFGLCHPHLLRQLFQSQSVVRSQGSHCGFSLGAAPLEFTSC